MRLVEALQLSERPVVAIVGAGGKTTTLFRLGRELPGPVFITTTTHLGIEQRKLADRHIIVPENGSIESSLEKTTEKVTLFSGPAAADGRLPGIGSANLEMLKDYCQENGIPLLIEADGARGLALKAPGPHEPVIPEGVSDVIVVAGMQGIGRQLTGEVVHRPELFSIASGLAVGELISPEAVAKMLLNPEGGLKNIPRTARPIALLNQADTDELKSQAGKIAGALVESYNAVLVGSLQTPGENEISACSKPTAGVILAAGAAARFGQPKPLLEWRGEPFVRHIAKTALQSGLRPGVVVTGLASEGVRAAVAGLPVKVVYNPDWQSGQASSVKTGLMALPARTGAAFFFVADQPQITPTLLAAAMEQHRKTLPAVIAPLIDGKRSNPVLFDRAAFDALNTITGDAGGRQVFSRFTVSWLEWNDTNMLLDVDTPQDYQRLLELK